MFITKRIEKYKEYTFCSYSRSHSHHHQLILIIFSTFQMSSWINKSVAALAVASLCAGTNAFSNTSSPDGTLHLTFQGKKSSIHPNPRGVDNAKLNRREDSLEVPLDNLLMYYNIEIGLGTPSQQFNLLIDTGSSDLWVIDESNKNCGETDNSGAAINCSQSGIFHTADSSTYQKNNSDFYISYEDNTVAEGDWSTDTLNLQGVDIPNMSFGLATTANSSIGVLGIGYMSNEASESNGYSYENLPILLKNQGIINTAAYSLWLNDLNAQEGNLLFGGVDHAKYSGPLVTVPTLKESSDESSPSSFMVSFDGLTVNQNGKSKQVLSSSISALLDSGTSLSYFPTKTANAILNTLKATYDDSLGYYTQSCNLQGNLVYKFSSAEITVPFSSLMLPLSDDTHQPKMPNGEPACGVGILPGDLPFALLGDTFLRSAYVVYDLDNDTIGLAQTIHGATDSNIEVIQGSIPSR